MLNKSIRISLMVIGWLLMTCALRAETIPFLPPEARPQPEANKPWPQNKFLVLAYHDVEDDAADQRYLAVRTSALNDQIGWLLHNGYKAVSVQNILDANAGLITLPPKAFLLSFDDGYSSFYTRVWPLLKAWNVPALWAPVGSWVDTPGQKKVDFGGLMTPRERFATWEMVRELAQSPLVEIGAHTWASHYGIQANPQGSREPAVANRFYDKASGRYESDQQFHQRIDTDVRKVSDKIADVTGKAPRAWVWPYGAANGTSLAIAKSRGYQLAFTLGDGLGDVRDLDNIPRLLISGNPSIKAFASQVTQIQEREPVRVMHVDLDYVYDKDPVQQRKNIDKLIQRVYDMKITHVFLQAFSDPLGDGTVKALYFPNRRLPMRADLFNFVAWQLQTRGGAKVYAWMPVLAFDLNGSLPRVQRWDAQSNTLRQATRPYVRLSPWNSQVRDQIRDIYQDLARYATFDGVLFHDDAVLTDYEDAGAGAMAAWRAAGHREDIAQIRQNPAALHAWTRFKSQALIDFTRTLSQSVKAIRGPQVRTARNIFALPILQPESEAWFAQNLDDFLAAYDWTVPMAMPLMESVPVAESDAWLVRLVRAVSARPGALNKTIFELQAKDWTLPQQNAIPDQQLVDWMRTLQLNGVNNYGYYPDDFLNNQPDISKIRPLFSSYWYPNND
ncbi:TPA: poly-beta-1,6-N-acetyl-D-glucosamine N-deacetylase PgaB [Klebsiella aerogenes]|uniref:poly-beta-1,6-N-acetyl-D-glucosamine N-deacetylase PgaB n=1 Tax=Klebsiella aerogenes TaxID=548 RepID=UPI0021A75675|nr:poly-beta-1,6-N-acetyl-D-glucosamine N-deacetylase PgaB [Klebsiella aerogenes]MCT1422641.1 poly-beta-1,6-N-acetyl-D-glucosamine N-deacetylase PgaB [Klebsiella aerogenes]MCT1502857.1 poly-beta-1,6-N-acetyl-D-glucosamine N-deacetylase PgaB [Klebsiella aerogenes]MCT1792735.1 poly-beta-1,6-N-acetyl-D-glucosamine N-deacetylase PgaB [Klebsiella aerogenes]MCT2312107.1 poly-beta-1,6-N-acetyl-D-glucosamine N-deacetylase PgaB [Klebsiella aerogenes]MCT2319633.1 poly-beta-1,6-N-acetyl-D-glucosamine N-d